MSEAINTLEAIRTVLIVTLMVCLTLFSVGVLHGVHLVLFTDWMKESSHEV